MKDRHKRLCGLNKNSTMRFFEPRFLIAKPDYQGIRASYLTDYEQRMNGCGENGKCCPGLSSSSLVLPTGLRRCFKSHWNPFVPSPMAVIPARSAGLNAVEARR